jgi:hypothetical protein
MIKWPGSGGGLQQIGARLSTLKKARLFYLVHGYLTDFDKVNRVNWLRAKARWSRCQEQKELVEMEMIWTYLGLSRRSKKWADVKSTGSSGMQAYAAKQEAVWKSFAVRAWQEFGLKELLQDLQKVIGDVHPDIGDHM